jgi:hypothetical protein
MSSKKRRLARGIGAAIAAAGTFAIGTASADSDDDFNEL